MRTLRTKKGLKVDTDLSDEQAINIVSGIHTSRFGQDLVRKCRSGITLSEDQFTWLHKIALEAIGHNNQVCVDDSEVNLLPIYQLIKYGHKGGGFPLIRLTIPDGRMLFIGLNSGATSAHPWNVKVCGGRWKDGAYYGRIDGLGIFYKTKECDNLILDYLKLLAALPKSIVSNNGRSTGICPLCGQDLATDDAITNGFGRSCGERFGLL